MPGTSGSPASMTATPVGGAVVVCPPEETLTGTPPEGPVIVCPPEEALRKESETNVTCLVSGCGRVFAQPSARRFHMVKVHRILETDQDAALERNRPAARRREEQFHCPVAGCKYNVKLGRFFTSMKNLNQHYRHVHAEKKYACTRCSHAFSQLRDLKRHEKTCGLKFLCRQCSNIYNSKDALHVHCARTGHHSGFSSINSQVFRDAVDGSFCSSSVPQNLIELPAPNAGPQPCTADSSSRETEAATPQSVTPSATVPSAEKLDKPQHAEDQPEECTAQCAGITENPQPSVKPADTSLREAPKTTYILPKPDALYLPVQLQVNQKDMSVCGGQSGPVILIVNKPPPAATAPKRLQPIAPKFRCPSAMRSKTASSLGQRTQQQPHIQQPAQLIPNKPNAAAGTQTLYSPACFAETQTLQVPREQEDCIRPESVASTRKPGKHRHRNWTEIARPAGSGTHSVSVGTLPAKKRRVANSSRTSVKGVQTHNPPALIMQENMMSDITRQHLHEGVSTSDISFITSGCGESAAIETQSACVETVSAPLTLPDINLMNAPHEQVLQAGPAPARMPPQMVSVSTDMSRANISVGTMPSPPLPQSSDFGAHLSSASVTTIGTDPAVSMSDMAGSSSKDLSLCSVFSQETQTSFWAEFQASIAESNATQTMESYLADTNPVSLSMPLLMESGVQTCHAQNTHTQTWPQVEDTSASSQSKSVGVGTSLLDDQQSSSLFEGMETEGLSRSIGIDTQLFDDLFPEVSSRSVAISTPLFDNLDSMPASGQPSSMENAMFQPIGQRSVGVSPLGHDLSDLDCLSRSNEGQATSSQTVSQSLSGGEGTQLLQYESIATASVQTDTDFELPVFLTAASQTPHCDPSSTNMETQTVDLVSQLLTNMQTQTSGDILADLNFADIETQTPALSSAHALTSVQTQTAASSARMSSAYIDTETQTLLPNLHLTENSFTDSHTQTTMEQFASLVDELEKN